MRRTRQQLRPLAPLLCLAAYLSGCHSWNRHHFPASGASTAVAGGGPVRLTLADGTTLVLSGARVIGDSVVGDVGTPPRRAAVALADVHNVQAVGERRSRRGRPSALAVAATAAVATVVASVTLALLLAASGTR